MLTTILMTTLLLGPSVPDEVRLRSGEVVIGKTRSTGDQIEVESRDGSKRRIALADVERVRTEQELRDEVAALAANAGRSAFAQFELARLAHGYELEREMWAHLERCVAAKPEGVVDQRLSSFLAGLEPYLLPPNWRRRDADTRVRELLFRVRSNTSPAMARAVEEVLVAMPDADASIRKRARSCNQPQRLVAVRALQRRPAEGNDRFVWRTIVLDGSSANRSAVADLVTASGATQPAVDYLAGGLLHSRLECRLRTAEALGLLASPDAAAHLASTGPAAVALAGGGAPVRANMAILQQTSYVRDFDVEVAQAAAIANPQVDAITSGVVLDVTVASVTEHRYLTVDAWRRALRRATGEDPGGDPDRWAEWYEHWRARQLGPKTDPRK